MRVFIAGISGLLGLNAALQLRDQHLVSGCYNSHPVAMDGVTSVGLDVTDFPSLSSTLQDLRPDVVLNTVALTNVDQCEADPAMAERLNVLATRNLAAVSRSLGARLVHISTDHLFSGTKSWSTETDAPHPLNSYARTKLLAEAAAPDECPGSMVIRTNFFGWGTSIRASFSDWVLDGLEKGAQLTMFADVYTTPLLIGDLVDVVMALVDRGASGIFNVGSRDRVSKYGFAVEEAKVFGHSPDNLLPISMDDINLRAMRPKDMSLSSEKVETYLGSPMPALGESLTRLKSQGEDGHPSALEAALRQATAGKTASY